MEEMPPFQVMMARNKLMHSDASVENARAFKPRATDVYISTYPKCGTTWMQQICHGLRSGGSMDFGEVCEVVPWDILALDCKQNLEDEQVCNPRVFKSHESWGDIAKGDGVKYIYVARNPLDAFVSFHKFMPAYCGIDPDGISMDEFADAIFAGASQAGQIWHHFLGWWQRRHDPDVLFIFFEDMKSDLRGSVAKVAAHMGIDADDALLDLITKQSHYSFMSEHAAQFDDHFVREIVLQQMGMPKDSPFTVGKVRKDGGKTGGRSTIPAHLVERLGKSWEQVVTLACPELKTFEAMRAAHPLLLNTRLAEVVYAHPSRCALGEGAVWDPCTGRLLWIDIVRGKLFSFDEATADNRDLHLKQLLGTVVPVSKDLCVVAGVKGFAIVDQNTGEPKAMIGANPEAASWSLRWNDGKCDPQGRLWVGSMDMNFGQPWVATGSGSLYCVQGSGATATIEKKLGGVSISNGICWNKAGDTMFFIDTVTLSIDAFDFDGVTGSISNKRPVVKLAEGEGYPDGMTIASDDSLFVATWAGGAVRRFDSASGELIQMIAVPGASQVTSCAFGGPKLDQLYITTASAGIDGAKLAEGSEEANAGHLFKCDMSNSDVTGMPANLYNLAGGSGCSSSKGACIGAEGVPCTSNDSSKRGSGRAAFDVTSFIVGVAAAVLVGAIISKSK